jgi:hypothetical protein
MRLRLHKTMESLTEKAKQVKLKEHILRGNIARSWTELAEMKALMWPLISETRKFLLVQGARRAQYYKYHASPDEIRVASFDKKIVAASGEQGNITVEEAVLYWTEVLCHVLDHKTDLPKILHIRSIHSRSSTMLQIS